MRVGYSHGIKCHLLETAYELQKKNIVAIQWRNQTLTGYQINIILKMTGPHITMEGCPRVTHNKMYNSFPAKNTLPEYNEEISDKPKLRNILFLKSGKGESYILQKYLCNRRLQNLSRIKETEGQDNQKKYVNLELYVLLGQLTKLEYEW